MVQLTNLDVAFKLTFLNFCEYIILFRLFFDNKYRLFVCLLLCWSNEVLA